MRHYAGYDTVAEAVQYFDRLREKEAQGKVDRVALFEVLETNRKPYEKPYVVTWSERTD